VTDDFNFSEPNEPAEFGYEEQQQQHDDQLAQENEQLRLLVEQQAAQIEALEIALVQERAEIERLGKELSGVFDVAFNQMETGVVFRHNVGDYLRRVLVHLEAERNKLRAALGRARLSVRGYAATWRSDSTQRQEQEALLEQIDAVLEGK
jgi:hypothetical protein